MKETAQQEMLNLIEEIKKKSYSELKTWVIEEHSEAKEKKLSPGKSLYCEAYAFWDDKAEGDIRVFMEVIPFGGKRFGKDRDKKLIQTLLKKKPGS